MLDPSLTAFRPGSTASDVCKYGLGCIGGLFLLLFIIGSVFFGDHCAQVLANEEHTTVYWSPQLAAMLAFFGWCSQMIILNWPVIRYLQTPVLKRYQTVETSTAKVLSRDRRQSGRRIVHEVILVYFPDVHRNFAFCKKFTVDHVEYGQSNFDIRVLPELGSSAILEKTYQDRAHCGSSHNMKLVASSFLAPVMWALVIYYTVQMQPYSRGDFWVQWGLLLLFVASFISALCLAIVFTWNSVQTMLYADAMRIPSSRIPSELMDDDEWSGDVGTAEFTENDDENEQHSDLELV